METQLHLNVMRDPWLKIQWLDGRTDTVSLYKAITEAQSIRKLMPAGLNKYTTYCLYSFITDFIQWVYKPKAYDQDTAKEAILELYEKGCFDSKTLDDYISYYENELHRSFDVFDSEHPFLQISREEREQIFGEKLKDAKPLSSSSFGLEYSSGNNVVFEHRRNSIDYETYMKKIKENGRKKLALQDCYDYTPEDIVVGLIYSLSFCQASGAGSKACVAVSGSGGLHPIAVINEGDSLFVTVCASIGTAAEYSFKPVWEREHYFTGASEIIQAETVEKNPVVLTYSPTSYVQLISDRQALKKNISEPNSEMPKSLYPLWIRYYPRAIRTTVKTKNTEYDSAMTFDFHKIAKSAASSTIQTRLLQLGVNASECPVITVNLKALHKAYPDLSLETKFYVCTHANAASKSIREMSNIMIWPKGKAFIDSPQAKIAVSAIMKRISTLAYLTAYYLTVAQGYAKGIVEINEEGKYTIGGKAISSYTNTAGTYVTSAIEKCMWELENKYYDRFLDPDEEDFSDIEGHFYDVFYRLFNEQIQKISRLSMIHRVEVKNRWKRTTLN